MVQSRFSAAITAFAAAILMVSSPALSADIAVEPEPETVAEHNWYVSLHGGIKFNEDWDDTIDASSAAPGFDVEADYVLEPDNGWRAGGAVGHRFSSIFSVEGELNELLKELGSKQVNLFVGRFIFRDTSHQRLSKDDEPRAPTVIIAEMKRRALIVFSPAQTRTINREVDTLSEAEQIDKIRKHLDEGGYIRKWPFYLHKFRMQYEEEKGHDVLALDEMDEPPFQTTGVMP